MPLLTSLSARSLAHCTRRQFHPLLLSSRTATPRSILVKTMSNQETHPGGQFREDESPALGSWTREAPYRVRTEEEGFKPKLHGECFCGTVKYQLSRDEPLASKFCHCDGCQVQHGAPYQFAAIFNKTDINFTHGHKHLEWFEPKNMVFERNLPCKVRCSVCRTPIMDEGRNMLLLFPSLIRFGHTAEGKKAREKFTPKYHIFYSQRIADVPDGLPKWSGMNDESELMKEP